MVRRTIDDGDRLRAVVLRDWAVAVCVAGVRAGELSPIRGYDVMPKCTVHYRGCGCARGSVRRYTTNHHRHSMSRAFDAIRRALGAVPWHEDGDLEIVT